MQGCNYDNIAPSILLEGRTPLEPLFEQAALRWKKTLATLDVVVTGVEFGHGRRRDVLSDYTFAVLHDGKLLNVDKAYSGLTDIEIAEMTQYFKRHTVQGFGRFRLVEPSVVIEVAFNGIQKERPPRQRLRSTFPRIVRIRSDKTVADIDRLETVEKLYTRHIGG